MALPDTHIYAHRIARVLTGAAQVSSSALTEAIQMGVRDSIGRMTGKKHRDLLHTDFYEVESVAYPKSVPLTTPALTMKLNYINYCIF